MLQQLTSIAATIALEIGASLAILMGWCRWLAALVGGFLLVAWYDLRRRAGSEP